MMVNGNVSQKLKYLNELTEVPILGHLFQEEKILELVALEKYE
jgi:hypothetical protein